jgi:beta-lactamase class A
MKNFFKSYWVVGSLAFMLGVLVVICFSKWQEVHSKNPYPLLDPGATTVSTQDLLVRFQPLRQALLNQFTEHEDFYVGLYFEYLPTGANIVVNNDRAMWPASLIKIPVAMAVMKKVERGEWKLDNQLVILDEDKDASFGDLYKEPSGTTLTIREFLHATLVDSDNTAHFVLLRNLDTDELEDVFIHLGLETVLEDLKKKPEAESEDNRMTAKTYSVFFRSLYNATYLSIENSQLFLQFLTEGPKEYGRSGIPADIVFAHKTGIRSEDRVWADAGVVYLDRRPYLLTIMLEQKNKDQEINDEQIELIFKDIASQVYGYVQSL